MAETVKQKDFIEIDYTGRLKDEGLIFDTTSEKTAKDNGIFSERMKYKPAIVCVGEKFLITGLDNDVVGKEIGKEYTITLNAENGFGKKNAKLIQLVPLSKFKNQQIHPMPGLQIDIDGHVGIVKVVTGGRVMVDFNHPLSGKDLSYEYIIKRIVTEDSEKIKGYFDIALNMGVEVEKKENGYKIKTKHTMPDILGKEIEKKLKEMINENISLEFVSDAKPKETKKETKQKSEIKTE